MRNLFARILGGAKKQDTPAKTARTKFSIQPQDVFLVSFPKSGNTWVRHLIGNYLTKGEMNFANGAEFMPDIHYNPEQVEQLKFRPRFLKSHFPYQSDYPNVIYLVRDGRDVAVSLYYFLIKMKTIEKEMPFKQFLNDIYFPGNYQFGTWRNHIESWIDNKHVRILTLRYEDLLANSEDCLEKMLRFSNVLIEDEMVKRACKISSFDEMRKDELKHKNELKKMGHDLDNSGIAVVREGKSGGWKKYFDDTDEERFWQFNGELMRRLGYSREG